MKKLIPTFILILTLFLAACGGSTDVADSPSADHTPASAGNAKTQLNEDYENALPASTQLIIGSLQLEKAGQAIDETLAAEILPLWQAYQALSNADTTADAELQAVIKQIQDAMAPEQIQTIAALQLTAEDAQQLMQEQGIGFGRGLGDGNKDGGGAAMGGGGRSVGVLPGGRPGGGPGGIEQLSPEARATAIAERFGGDDAGVFLERALLNALIRDLQVKTGEVDAVQAEPGGGFAGRFVESVAEASGVAAETLQAGLDEGKSLTAVITESGGDLDAAREALRQLFADRGLTAEELELRIDQILNGG